MITEIADGQPVTTTELAEEQEERDSYIDIKDGLHGAGQRLTITDRTVTTLSFRLKKTGSPSGEVVFRLRDVESEAVLASKTFPIGSIAEAPAVCKVTFDTPIAVDQDAWIYCEHTEGDTDNYISLSYNSVGVKPLGWLMQVNAGVPWVTEWVDRDCAYWYEYTPTAAGGIDCFDHCTAYEVVYDSEDSLIDTYQPKDAFKIFEGDSRLVAINRLLFYTGCVKIVKADGKIHVFVPTTTGITYKSEYSLESGHTFFSKAIRNALVIPNRIIVKSLKEDDDQYSGEKTDPTSYALLPITGRPIRTSLTGNAQGLSIATAMISRLVMDAQRGAASVPMNLGSEVFDYDIVTDSRQDDSRVGNLGYIRRSWNPEAKEFNMAFNFGRVPLKSVAGTRPSLMKEYRPMLEPTLDEAVLRWGMIKGTLEVITANFEAVWGNFDNIIEILEGILTSLGWFEGESPTNLQILLALMNYYTKAQVNEKIDDLRDVAVVFIIDGGGAVITTGEKGHLRLPFAGTIVNAALAADQSGSIVIDIWKDTTVNFPPTVADTITASAKPTLSSAQSMLDAVLTGWTKTFAAGDYLAFKVDSIATIKRVTLTLIVRRT